MRKSALFFVLILVINFLIIIYPINIVFADTNEKRDIHIEVIPKETIFKIDNMKPGDWAPRTATVKNMGKKDFEYDMTMENRGTKTLFNELLLEISDDHGELYNGKLKDFTSLDSRKLAAGSEENIHMTIRFPAHLGNDFQGTDANIALLFYTKGVAGETDPDPDPDPDPIDPGDTDDPEEDDGEKEENDGSDEGDQDENGEEEEDKGVKDTTDNNKEEDTDAVKEENEDKGTVGITDSNGKIQGNHGSVLPNTATNIFNLLLVGGLLFILGGFIMTYHHLKRRKMNE